MKPVVVGMTGASGAPYARRLLEVLLSSDCEVHLAVSQAAAQVWQQELGWPLPLADDFDPSKLKLASTANLARLRYFGSRDYNAPMASGSFATLGMVVCPCSGGTLSSIACGAASNLVRRAAEVHLKERRKLILVTRETPLSLPSINNMKAVTEAGAVVLPAAPGWYHGVTRLADLVDFVVARILQQLGIAHQLVREWGTVTDRPVDEEPVS